MSRRAAIALSVLAALTFWSAVPAGAVGGPEEIKSLRGLKTLAVEVAVVGRKAAAPQVTNQSLVAAIRRAFARHRLKGANRARATLRVTVHVLNKNVAYISAHVVQSATLLRKPGARLKVVTWTLNAPVATQKIIEAMDRIVARLARDRRLAG